MARQAAITGLGAITAAGNGVPEFWRALLDGRDGLEPVRSFDASRYVCPVAAEVRDVPPDPLGETDERGHLLALAAAAEALAGRDDFGGAQAAVVVGTTLGGNRLWTEWLAGATWNGAAPAALRASSMTAATRLLARRFGARGPVSTLSVACASGTAAIGQAAALVRRGEVDVALAGGYDALSEFVFAGFDSLRALTRSTVRPFDRRRDGLALGEGAGFVVLEDADAAARRGARIHALVSGYGSGSDALHMTRPSPDGAGLARAARAALADAGVRSDAIGFVSTHGTATPFNDRMESKALRCVLGPRADDVPVNSIKSSIGHTLGAAGALEAVMCARVLSEGIAPPTPHHEEADEECALRVVSGAPLPVTGGAVLSTSAAFGGTNAALVFERA